MDRFKMMLALTFLLASVTSGELVDWLINDVKIPAQVNEIENGQLLKLSNGIVTRTFLISPGFATIDLYSHEKNSSVLRAIDPEARITLDGIAYDVGGIKTPISRAYLNRTALYQDGGIYPNPGSFQFSHYTLGQTVAPYQYTPRRGVPNSLTWPPKGTQLRVTFVPPKHAPPKHKDVRIDIVYELYEGMPLFTKWVSVSVEGNSVSGSYDIDVSVDAVEILAVNEEWADWIYLQSDLPHGVKLNRSTEVGREAGSAQTIFTYQLENRVVFNLNPGNPEVKSFRVFEMLVGDDDKERMGLAKRRLTRRLAPQTMEFPVFFHLTDKDRIREAADQCAEVGFDMILLSFGTGFDLEGILANATALAALRDDIAYANSRGIEVGAYDLIGGTRHENIPDQWIAVNHDEIKSVCLASGWYENIVEKVLAINEIANLTALEADGTYYAYTCSSKTHKHHQNLQDSVYKQSLRQGMMFTEMMKNGIYINQPELFFFFGGHKSGMGYDESQFSLPRWMDISISRQTVYVNTYHYIPSQGWMFLPLVQYHGGGEAATFEPLEQNLKAYEWALAQYFGAGVQACYRGFRLYDTEKTKQVVKKWTDFNRKYRSILQGDLIHVKRADMQGLDAYLHVPDPAFPCPYSGLVMIFNPSNNIGRLEDNTWLKIPLYYTGLTDVAYLTREGDLSTRVKHNLARDYSVTINIDIEPASFTWLLIEAN